MLKKILLPLISLVLIVALGILIFYNKKESDLTKVKVADAHHSSCRHYLINN